MIDVTVQTGKLPVQVTVQAKTSGRAGLVEFRLYQAAQFSTSQRQWRSAAGKITSGLVLLLCPSIKGWVSSFLTAHQHIIGQCSIWPPTVGPCSSLFLSPWDHKWINYSSPWCLDRVTPDLRLFSQPQTPTYILNGIQHSLPLLSLICSFQFRWALQLLCHNCFSKGRFYFSFNP